ncbi:MAG: matrixin family metalloprotease [Syntrophales bacterium]
MDSVNRIYGGNGIVRSSDCPEANNYNIGAWYFMNGYMGPAECLSEPSAGPGRVVLAYTLPGTTRSMGINLNFSWSTDGSPASNEFDMQSVVSHEFGHILGLAHQTNGVCAASPDISCATYGDGKETMSYGPTGELCQRTLAPHDIETVNALY